LIGGTYVKTTENSDYNVCKIYKNMLIVACINYRNMLTNMHKLQDIAD
jgi:hypothetical protein